MSQVLDVPRNATALLSAALVAGGCMLDSFPCPLCSTPLISKKGDNTPFCVVCNAPIYTEATAPKYTTAAPAADTDDFDEEVDYVAPPSHYSTTPSTAVADLGTYLLKGYTMLSDVCESCNTPMLRSKTGEVICVSCSKGSEVSVQRDGVVQRRVCEC